MTSEHGSVGTQATIAPGTSRHGSRHALASLACALRASDAVHLATAVAAGADRFVTNNSRDFTTAISEIAITHPADLPDPTES